MLLQKNCLTTKMWLDKTVLQGLIIKKIQKRKRKTIPEIANETGKDKILRIQNRNAIVKSFFNHIIALLFIATSFSSCDRNRLFDQNKEIFNHTWKRAQVIHLEVDITDTITKNNFYINLRNGNKYAYNNIFLFVTSRLPNGHTNRDTMEILLADAQGKWLGKKTGDIIDNRVPIKRGVVFPMSGKYSFDIEQGMRDENLKDIYDVGLRIEKQQ